MKVKCDFCGSMYEDTLNNCPNCGATNTQVRRSTPDQPTTIEDLKAWYESKGLPPYETTRFFIGVDYTGPRAFGIYKDPYNGNFVVYKNKDNGTRAVRYEGTDEAYAVNELFMRLKQEIVEQKARNASRGVSPYYPNTTTSYSRPAASYKKRIGVIGKIIAVIFGIHLITIIGIGIFTFSYEQKRGADRGYYEFNGEIYYCMGGGDNWAHYNRSSGEWEKAAAAPADVLVKNKTAKDYYRSYLHDQEDEFPDFTTSRIYYEYEYSDGYARNGYYEYDDNDYYHLDSYDTSSWYIYNDSGNWEHVDYNSLPEPLQFEYEAKDFYYYPTWDSSTQISDFTETSYYRDYEREQEVSRTSSYDDDDDDSWSSYDSSDYSWDSGSDSWDSGSTDWGSDW